MSKEKLFNFKPSEFLLYQKRDKNFPASIEIPGLRLNGLNGLNGKKFDIDADFRNILRIFAMLKDYDIPERKRIDTLIRWFFVSDLSDILYEYSENIIKTFVNFINPEENRYAGENNEDNEAEANEKEHGEYTGNGRLFCYDFDAGEIYAGFISEYGIDLIDADSPNYVRHMHWYKFKILLANLSSDSMFKKKIELRFLDLSRFTGKALAEMTRAKESVQLPEEYAEYTEYTEYTDIRI